MRVKKEGKNVGYRPAGGGVKKKRLEKSFLEGGGKSKKSRGCPEFR